MSPAFLVGELHGVLLRAPSTKGDRYFQDLAAAARHFRGSLHSKRCRRLRELDAAFALLRHNNVCSAKVSTDEVMADLDIMETEMPATPAAANACLATSLSGEGGISPKLTAVGVYGRQLPNDEAPAADDDVPILHLEAAPPSNV